MEMANILLKQLRDIKTTQVQRKPVPNVKPQSTPPAIQAPPQIPPLPIQYPSSPAPAAKPPPGTYNVPVPADPGYAAPTAKDQAGPAQYPASQPGAYVKPPMHSPQASYEQAPTRSEVPPARPSPPQQPSAQVNIALP